MKTTEAILGCALAMLYKLGFSAVWSNLGTDRKGRGQITWRLDVSVKADRCLLRSPPDFAIAIHWGLFHYLCSKEAVTEPLIPADWEFRR